ncbi:hypothetical protein C4568_04465 [Candidatus Parcubacteria bacterium]|nr:MAG: hypothetical protein C4568_04465 [Candidatus Parcubacteria bacterium]
MSAPSASPAYRNHLSHVIDRWFPTPRVILPLAVGIDISDSSIKWMTLKEVSNGYIVAAEGNKPLPPGLVVGGILQDVAGLSHVLVEIKSQFGGATAAHAALPEESAYVFSMHVPAGSDRDQILRMIEFEFEGRVPIPPSAAVYDFSVIQKNDGTEGDEISVTVFPRDIAANYAESFALADIELLSLEVEARSIGRAVSSREADEPITLLVDFGRARTGFAVLKHGVPIFTSTVDVGGESILEAVQHALSITRDEAELFCDTEGLLARTEKTSAGTEAIQKGAAMLMSEIERHYRYWDTRRNDKGERVTPVGRIILIGGSANLKGFPEYVAGQIHASVELGNVWRHICDFDVYIPPIDRHTSLQFATAAGLALRTA